MGLVVRVSVPIFRVLVQLNGPDFLIQKNLELSVSHSAPYILVLTM